MLSDCLMLIFKGICIVQLMSFWFMHYDELEGSNQNAYPEAVKIPG